MNAVTAREFRTGTHAADVPDDKMDQIRELLFGDYQRQTEQRITALEARIRDLEAQQARRFEQVQGRVEAMYGEVKSGRRTSFDQLATGILELGEQIKKIARE